MKSDLVPLAEEKANYGKIVKTAVRELWSLEYEIEEIQTEFAKGIGSIDIANLTDDFVEDVMLQSKPLQGILMAIRLRQKDALKRFRLQHHIFYEIIGQISNIDGTDTLGEFSLDLFNFILQRPKFSDSSFDDLSIIGLFFCQRDQI